ncbi:MAG: hypothetical protein ACYSUV_21540, partial [Planctomycetota bacterium]
TACNAHGSRRYDFESETFVASPLQASLGHHGHSSPRGDGSDNLVAVDMRNLSQSGDVTHPLQSKSNGGYSLNYQPCVAFQPRYARNGRRAPDTVAAPLTAEAGRTGKGDSAQCVAFDYTVQGSERTLCPGAFDVSLRKRPADSRDSPMTG